MKILLQHKIFIGYFLLMVIIGSMVAIILHERNRVQKIEVESISIFQTQHNISHPCMYPRQSRQECDPRSRLLLRRRWYPSPGRRY